MIQPPHQNSDSQQPDVNSSIQHQADCSKVEAKKATVQGDDNRVIQGNNNRAVQGDNNIAIQGDNNTTLIIQFNKLKKYGLFIVLFIILFSFAVINLVKPVSIQTDTTPISEGQKLLDKGDTKRAEEKFNEAKKLDPKSPEPWYWQARVALAQNNQLTALKYLDQALYIMPRHSYSLGLKIKLLLLNGGEGIKKAQEIANQSYGSSPELNLWLDCLNQKKIFTSLSTTEIELDQLCQFSDINNKK